jgi:diaminohydroxyphosphoribosylaminopyrimidine deaminase/5-amino-6-(5-phosphoribosylamino)uracil reductase
VIAAGVARFVIGSVDPVPNHGGGIAQLERAGIKVARALVDACDEANRPFLTLARLGRPAFTLKAAITLDGKIATRTGESHWITGEAARQDVHHLRDTHDAVMVGIGTVLADDPKLTARVPAGRDPIRIVVDSRLRTPAKAKVLAKGARVIVATCAKGSIKGAEMWRFKPTKAGHVPLDQLAKKLGEARITSVLVEGGGELHAAMFAADLADELAIYIAPFVIGGPAKSWVGGEGIAKLADATRLRVVGTEQLGVDLKVIARRPW